jgi:hypothetical protein
MLEHRDSIVLRNKGSSWGFKGRYGTIADPLISIERLDASGFKG